MTVSLPDILEADLDIVFIGINPGSYSALRGRYYARPSNLFWPMLYQSGLLPQPLGPEDDWKLIRFRMGLTDIAKRVTDGSADLSSDELRKGAMRVRKKILLYRPKIACFNGLTAYRALLGPTEGPGPQELRVGETRLFVIPSTSRRNAAYSKEAILGWFRLLKDFAKTNIGSEQSVTDSIHSEIR